jgi:hypothetical protein
MKKLFATLKQYPVSFLILILGAINAILTFYPGSMSVDSWQQFQQAVSGSYDDVHPPIMAWVWRYLLWIKKGPEPMLFLHVGMFWSGLFLIWYQLIKQKCHSYLLIPFLGFMPTVLGMIGVIWKDISLGSSLVLVVGLLGHQSKRTNIRKFLIVILLFYATAVRHNAVAMTLPFFLISCLVFKGQVYKGLTKEFFKSAFCGVKLLVGCLVVGFVLTRFILKTQKSDMYPSFVFFHDLSYIGEKLDLELVPESFRTSYYSKEQVGKALKDLRASDGFIYPREAPFKIIHDTQAIEKIKRVWMKNVIDHFPIYLQLRTQLFNSLNCIGFGQCRVSHFYMPNEFGGGIDKMAPWRSYLERKLSQIAAETLFYSGWFYLVIGIMGLVATYLIQGEWFVISFCLLLSSILYNLSFFITTVTCDFRYLWPATVLTTLGVVLILADFEKTRIMKKALEKIK